MRENDFFYIYDTLLKEIPEGIKIVDAYQEGYWTGVRTENSLGLGMTIETGIDGTVSPEDLIGKDIREVGELVKSWNFKDASYGLAAINSYYNSVEKAEKLGLGESTGDAFDVYTEDIAGKKVSVIGHFPFLEKKIGSICDLRILERKPQEGDYPDPACEVLLPDSDYVFITSSTFVNKTIVRLLELSKNAKVILVGPSTPMAEILFDMGVDNLSGFIAEDLDFCKEATSMPAFKRLFDGGKMVSLDK